MGKYKGFSLGNFTLEATNKTSSASTGNSEEKALDNSVSLEEETRDDGEEEQLSTDSDVEQGVDDEEGEQLSTNSDVEQVIDESNSEGDFTAVNRNTFVDPQAKPTSYIHLWGGERGGAGKSTGCMVMVHYLMEVVGDNTFYLVEADRSRPDVLNSYGDVLGDRCIKAFFSEADYKSESADRIFQLALKANVVVNLPAQVADPFDEWVERNCLEDLAEENHVRVVSWFCCTGEDDSVELFLNSLEKYTWMTHVFVRNRGVEPGINPETWTRISSEDRFNRAREKYNFRSVDLPKFYYSDRDRLKITPMSFSSALEKPGFFNVLAVKRTQKFLRECAVSLASTGLFSGGSGSDVVRPQTAEEDDNVNSNEEAMF